MNSHQRRKFVKAAMSELRGACQSELERGLIDAAEDHIRQKKLIDKLQEQIATLTRQRDLAVEALKEILEYAGIIEERCDSIATDKARAAIKESEGKG